MKHQVPRFLFCFLLMFSVLACAAAAFTPEMPELSAEAPAVTAKAALSAAAYGAKPAETTDDGVLVFFDNGNADDRINLTNISLQGVVEPFSETDGFITRSINTGDTVFAGSCGRTDLHGGSMKEMLSSLRRLGQLEGNFTVLPGHMEPSDLDMERSTNYYMTMAMRG